MSQARPYPTYQPQGNLARKPIVETITPQPTVKAPAKPATFKPRVMERPKRKIKRFNAWQAFFSALIWVAVLYQSMMQSSSLVSVHYEVEQIQLQSEKYKNENLAQYQLVGEMTNHDRLVNVLKEAGLSAGTRSAFELN